MKFGTKFGQKGYYFQLKSKEKEYHRSILHIRNSLGTKFYFKQTIFNFGTSFAQKEHSQSKLEKVNVTTEFRLFD